jgi:hypothetical protein
MKRKVAEFISNTEHVGTAAEVLAGLEHEQLTAAALLAEAADLDYDLDVPPVEERQAAVEAVLRGMLGGDFPEWWRTNVATEQLDKAPPAEFVGVGVESDTWQDQLDDWDEAVGAAGGEGSQRDRADAATRDVYGVGLVEFETEVVEFEQGEEAKALIAGNFRAVRDVMDDAAEAFDGEDGAE